MTTIPQFDREATRIMGLSVAFDGKRWNVMQDKLLVSPCCAYEDATAKRLDLVEAFISKADQHMIDAFLRADRIAELRSQIIQEYDAPFRGYGHRSDLIVFEVEWNGRLYGGEAYDDEELALERLKAALDASALTPLSSLIEADVMEAAE
jgi:hypothetical protein